MNIKNLLLEVYANGRRVTYESYEHPHGQAGDVFLRIDPQVVLNPGDRIEWSGDLPEGKTQLWVRYACTHPPLQRLRGVGNARLKDSDMIQVPADGNHPSEEAVKQNPYACGDGGCVLLVPGVPVGQHTNAGCRCIPLKMTPNERVRLREGIRWLAERLSKTEGEPVKPSMR